MRVVADGERDTMALQRYDVEYPDRPGRWEKRYWSPVNAPVLGPDGEVALLLHRVEEVTELLRARDRSDGGDRAGCWRPSCTRVLANYRKSTNGCAGPMRVNVRWH